MHDDHDDPLALMARHREAITPDAEKKKTDIFNSLEAFDKKYASAAQGKGFGARLTHAAQMLRQPFTGANTMKKTYMIAGGLCASVLTVGLVTTSQLYDASEIVRTTGSHGQGFAGGQTKETVAEQLAVGSAAGAGATADMELGQVTPAAPAMVAESFAPGMEDAATATPMPAPMATAPMPTGKLMAQRAMSNEVAASIAMMPSPDIVVQPGYQDQGRDKFTDIKTNPTKLTAEEPVSTFSVDVDTASYAFVRSALNSNTLPQKDAVRIEEMVNYFPYGYEAPSSKDTPFKANVALLPSPWSKHNQILRVGIKGYEMKQAKPHANLVFLLDTSGSMNEPNKLPLLKNSLKLLLDTLGEDDTVAIVTYAGSAGTALEPTKVKDKAKIIAALDGLQSYGSTAGAEGIRQAYQLAEQNFDKRGINRVLLATDGDFNVGITDPEELKSFVERKRETGVFLSVIGFGRGNYNDALMQTLAQNGNGTAAYIDTLNEARKVLVEEASASLFPIAKDVKIQVEFNPAKVSEYRLIGYETRMLNREDFNNDKIDAGDIGAGHTVTALYEITPAGSEGAKVDPLRYGKEKAAAKPAADASDELAFVKIRYKQPEGSVSKLITTPVTDATATANDADAKFATAVAAFGSLLRGDGMVGEFTYDDVIALAQQGKGADEFGYRAEFINLARLAKAVPAMEPLQH
ncbi:MAG: VWA domain-containing protein [Azospirillum brasilense]|nr:MAG: VWA domain-containing protein [Azospirillum brasilense]